MSGLSIAEQPALDTAHTAGRFLGQGVIVTGGAGGIGGMIVHRFLNDGANVAIVDLDSEVTAGGWFDFYQTISERCQEDGRA
jgi:NAD(P)-dependent dehydrogenase (short-subunit alcohol dehydrogenase family)